MELDMDEEFEDDFWISYISVQNMFSISQIHIITFIKNHSFSLLSSHRELSLRWSIRR